MIIKRKTVADTRNAAVLELLALAIQPPLFLRSMRQVTHAIPRSSAPRGLGIGLIRHATNGFEADGEIRQ